MVRTLVGLSLLFTLFCYPAYAQGLCPPMPLSETQNTIVKGSAEASVLTKWLSALKGNGEFQSSNQDIFGSNGAVDRAKVTAFVTECRLILQTFPAKDQLKEIRATYDRIFGGKQPQKPSSLRLQIQNPTQAISLLGDRQPAFGQNAVYCDAMKLKLIVAHDQLGTDPILVTSIAFLAEPLEFPAEQIGINCDVDTLKSVPYGIIQQNKFQLSISSTGKLGGRYLRSGKTGDSWVIQPRNILDGPSGAIAISLKGGEEPVGYDVLLHSLNRRVYKVWFEATYDAGGPKTAKSEAILIKR